MGKKSRLAGNGGKPKGKGGLTMIGGFALVVGLFFIGSLFLFKGAEPKPSPRQTSESRRSSSSGSGRRASDEMPPKKAADRPPPKKKRKEAAAASGEAKYDALEWRTLPRDMDSCLASQAELMTIPVAWPGFHALCIDSVDSASAQLTSMSVRLHSKSGSPSVEAMEGETRVLRAWDDGASTSPSPVLGALFDSLQKELLEHEFQKIDPMISTSAYDYKPNPWKLFTQRGAPVDDDADLISLGRGAALYLYTGGQFIWPGVRLGHKTDVPIPVTTDVAPEGYKMVTMVTRSLRPLVLELTGFLSDDECAFIKKYASSRMVPSGLAMMDSSGDSKDVRTSTQTFMERAGTEEIRALEERAHNLTRLPYDLGENIQVVRYTVGQKYGAHRDFFNPNDYHRQPHMLRSVEYGARNRLATVFWYLQTVSEGGETFFPRALNELGKEYHPWNGDHEDCYRGLYVPPTQGNAVLFYSMVPDGRLDERSLHGGCKPRGEHTEKWGANQWIWNHPQRNSGVAPRKGQPAKPRKPSGRKPGCEDSDSNCAQWAEAGECNNNPAYMEQACRASCGTC